MSVTSSSGVNLLELKLELNYHSFDANELSILFPISYLHGHTFPHPHGYFFYYYGLLLLVIGPNFSNQP